MFIAQRENLT